MHEIAISTTSTLAIFVLATSTELHTINTRISRELLGFTEISDRRIFRSKGTTIVITTCQTLNSLFGIFLIFEFAINVSKHVLVKIITHMKFFYRSILTRQFFVHFLVESIKILLLQITVLLNNLQSFVSTIRDHLK